MHKFGLTVQNAQLHLFAFLFAVAAGTVIGGPVGDKIGRKYVIWGSILGVAPFTLVLPYASLEWTGILTGDHWFYPRLGLFCYSGLCAGTAAGTHRHGFWPVFRLRLWHGRPWRRGVEACWRTIPASIWFIKSALLPLLGFLTIFLPDNRQKA